jgi:3',5'-nucleoside bisphosphate phosphatase
MSHRADLHIHTRYSDGSLSPEEVVKSADEKGLACCAITDHDSVSGVAQGIEAGNALGVEIIPAVEISAEESGREIHILGYCIDYKDNRLLGFLSNIRKDRINRLHKMIGLLKEHGVSVDINELLKIAGDVSISRLHIAKYMQKKGIVANWRDAFKTYIGDNKPCYVSSFRYTAKDVIEMIKLSGGISVIAHPGLYKIDSILLKLIQQGIKGIEVYHTEHSANMSAAYKDFAEKHNLLITGGSDCHGNVKGGLLIGKTTIPYSYVEALKNAAKGS